MSELAIRITRAAGVVLADHLVWSIIAEWRRTGILPRGVELRRGNYGKRIGARAWLKYIATVSETWYPGIVLCDYDSDNPPSVGLIMRRLAKARLRASWLRYDRTSRGWHLIIQLRNRLSLPETIALQALLGSDPHREAFNLARAIGLRKKPSAFWEARANILYGRKLWQGTKPEHAKPLTHVGGQKRKRQQR